MQNVSREGQRPRSSGEAAPGGRAASEEQEANEENEEQDGRESHGPCLPSVQRSSKNLGVSLLCYFVRWVWRLYQDPALAELLLILQRQERAGVAEATRFYHLSRSQASSPRASDGLELSWWAMPLNREYVPHGRGVVPAEGTCGGCT